MHKIFFLLKKVLCNSSCNICYIRFRLQSSKMLPTEGEEDLLEQLSGELGIPEFLQDLPMLEDNAMSGHGTIYDSLINDIPATTSASGSLFPDFSNALIDTKDCMTIDFSTTTFPPSPSNSDTSSGGSTVEPKDCLVAPISFTEVSPPVSPPSMMNLPAIQSGSIVSVPDLANIKIPIPKIQKPSKFTIQNSFGLPSHLIHFQCICRSDKSTFDFDLESTRPIVQRRCFAIECWQCNN